MLNGCNYPPKRILLNGCLVQHPQDDGLSSLTLLGYLVKGVNLSPIFARITHQP